MSEIVLPTKAIVWELRRAWATRVVVRASLSQRCVVPKVIGVVERMATTGAWVCIDGWEIPTDEIGAIGSPLVEEQIEYAETRLDPRSVMR